MIACGGIESIPPKSIHALVVNTSTTKEAHCTCKPERALIQSRARHCAGLHTPQARFRSARGASIDLCELLRTLQATALSITVDAPTSRQGSASGRLRTPARGCAECAKATYLPARGKGEQRCPRAPQVSAGRQATRLDGAPCACIALSTTVHCAVAQAGACSTLPLDMKSRSMPAPGFCATPSWCTVTHFCGEPILKRGHVEAPKRSSLHRVRSASAT